MIKLSSECDDAKLMSKNSMVYQKDDKIYIFKQLDNHTYRCINDNKIHANLENFDAVNETLFEKLEDLKC